MIEKGDKMEKGMCIEPRNSPQVNQRTNLWFTEELLNKEERKCMP